MRLREAVYVTTFQSFERLGEELSLEADRQGLERAAQVMFLSDGAPGLREIHQTHFPDAPAMSWTGVICAVPCIKPCKPPSVNWGRLTYAPST